MLTFSLYSVVSGFILGYYLGDRDATIEITRNWSEAVARAKDRNK